MESLNSLASSLPTAHQKAEQELLNNFKSAALSITTLYRSSRETSKRAYDAGYAAACQDLLNMIQHGVSAGGIDHGESREGMTIGRVMDWTEARLEALKQKDEEEEEEEEREKDRKPATTSAAPASSSAPPVAPAPKPSKSSPCAPTHPRPKEVKPPSPAFSPIQILPDPSSTATSSPASTPPILSTPLPLRASQRPTKPRPSTKGDGSAPFANLPSAHAFDFFADPLPRPAALAAMPTSVQSPIGVMADAVSAGVGAKRRHAMMMMLDAASPAAAMGGSSAPPLHHPHHLHHHHHHLHHHPLALAAGGGGVPAALGAGRRRERRSRVVNTQQNQAINLLSADVMMDVEEENGRERKRVARR